MNVTATRLTTAMDRRGLDQSALARAIGSTQGAISKIILGKTTNSRLLPKIATVLSVSLAWLLGLADDPDDGVSPISPPVVDHIMLPVALPSENALADMFEGLLLAIDRTQPVDELARELAQLLPTGLSQLQGRLFELPRPPRRRTSAAPSTPEAPATVEPAHQR